MTLHSKLKSGQRGITLLGILFVGAVLGFSAVLAMQVFPTYMEFLSIKKAANKASAGATVQEVRTIFDKAAQIDNITSVEGKDLVVSKEGDRVIVSFAYDKEIHIAGPAYLLMKYSSSAGVRTY